MVYRFGIAWRYCGQPLAILARWIWSSRETTNFTYDLTLQNKRYLAALLADVLGIEFDTAMGYMNEIEADQAFKAHIESVLRRDSRAARADAQVHLGRRLGWYVLVRVLKPRAVVETGIDKGLGSCVLAAALLRNRAEGYEGYYWGTDINPAAGFLFCDEYASCGEVLVGDSIESLRQLDAPIDLFINDSDHSSDYEAREYEVIESKLSDRALIIGDNAHCSDALLNFSLRRGRDFAFFREAPLDHWYPGSGIGISFMRTPRRREAARRPAADIDTSEPSETNRLCDLNRAA